MSGPAADAFERHAGAVNVNVVANWSASLRPTIGFTTDDVLSAVDAAIARAERASEDAQRRESGITGVIASFVRWPSVLREAVDPAKVGQARTAAAIGYVAQVLVGVAASLITAGLIWLGIELLG